MIIFDFIRSILDDLYSVYTVIDVTRLLDILQLIMSIIVYIVSKIGISFRFSFSYLQSTVDWCENNYAVTVYIAEYWNTLSGICLMLSGLSFYANNRDWIYSLHRSVRNDIKYLLWYVVSVGIGTMLFHSTLTFPFQMIDELSMLALAHQYITTITKLRTTASCVSSTVLDRIDGIQLFFYTYLLYLISAYFLDSFMQIALFHLYLKLFEGSIIYTLYTLSKNLNTMAYYTITAKHKREYASRYTDTVYKKATGKYALNRYRDSLLLNAIQSDIRTYVVLRKTLSRNIQIGILCYASSLLMWCIENRFCTYVEPFQLHAVWHVLSSIGVYYLLKILKNHIMIDTVIYS